MAVAALKAEVSWFTAFVLYTDFPSHDGRCLLPFLS